MEEPTMKIGKNLTLSPGKVTKKNNFLSETQYKKLKNQQNMNM